MSEIVQTATVVKPSVPTWTAEDGKALLQPWARLHDAIESGLRLEAVSGKSENETDRIIASVRVILGELCQTVELTPRICEALNSLHEPLVKALVVGQGRTLPGGYDAMMYAQGMIGKIPSNRKVGDAAVRAGKSYKVS